MKQVSFSVYVQARDGKAEVERMYGEIPDGIYIVSGHNLDGEQQISVTWQRSQRDEPQTHEQRGVH